MIDEKDKAQEAIAKLDGAPKPGHVIGIKGVIAVSLREADLEPLLTYRPFEESVAWTCPFASPCTLQPPDYGRDSPRALAIWDNLSYAPQPGQIFRHYKGGLYTAVATSLEVRTLVPMVTYVSNARGTYWTRTLANFTEDVWVENVPGPVSRFGREYD